MERSNLKKIIAIFVVIIIIVIIAVFTFGKKGDDSENETNTPKNTTSQNISNNVENETNDNYVSPDEDHGNPITSDPSL